MDNSQNIKLLKSLVVHEECEWIEFKANKDDKETIGKYLSGLSNAASIAGQRYGYLIFGIDDDTKNIVGTKFNPFKITKGTEELVQTLSNQVYPRVDFKFIKVEIEDKYIVIMKIDATKNTPVSFKKIEYIRNGSNIRNLIDFPEKAAKIWGNRNFTNFEKGIASGELDEDEILDLLDYPKMFDLLNLRLPTDRKGIIEKLIECDFIIKTEERFAITNLGAISIAKDLSRFERLKNKSVRVIRYEGNSKLKTKLEQIGRKGYAVGFEGLLDFIEALLPNNEIIEKALRKEVKMYPIITIRELVANALIHQDFSVTGMSPMIEIYDNRIEIINPGIPLIDADRLIDHTPRSRNEELAGMMKNMYICEERGSGIDKVVYNVELYQLPAPKFINDSSSFKVILYAHKSLSDMSKEDKIRACYQHCVLKYVSGEELMSNSTLRERFNIDHHPTISKIIKEATEAGLIKVNDPTAANKFKKYIPYS